MFNASGCKITPAPLYSICKYAVYNTLLQVNDTAMCIISLKDDV